MKIERLKNNANDFRIESIWHEIHLQRSDEHTGNVHIQNAYSGGIRMIVSSEKLLSTGIALIPEIDIT